MEHTGLHILKRISTEHHDAVLHHLQTSGNVSVRAQAIKILSASGDTRIITPGATCRIRSSTRRQDEQVQGGAHDTGNNHGCSCHNGCEAVEECVNTMVHTTANLSGAVE